MDLAYSHQTIEEHFISLLIQTSSGIWNKMSHLRSCYWKVWIFFGPATNVPPGWTWEAWDLPWDFVLGSPREYLETFIFPVLLPGMASLLHQAKQEKCFEVGCLAGSFIFKFSILHFNQMVAYYLSTIKLLLSKWPLWNGKPVFWVTFPSPTVTCSYAHTHTIICLVSQALERLSILFGVPACPSYV